MKILLILFYLLLIVGCNNELPDLPPAPWELPPTAPTNLTAERTGETEVTLQWKDESEYETGFVVEESVGGKGNFVKKTQLSAHETTVVLKDFTTPASYYFRINAFNDYGSSDYSEIAEIIFAAPVAPTDLLAERTEATEFTLNWSSEEVYVDSFTIEESFNSHTDFQQVAQTEQGNVTVVLTERNQIGWYYYRVKSHSYFGYSAYSEVSSVELLVPNAPTNLRAERTGETEITLSWACDEVYIDSFRVEESYGDQNNYRQVARTVRNVLSTVLQERSQAGTYYYRVVTVNSVDNSAFSATASINMAGPNEPTNIQAERSGETEFRLNWTNNDELVDSIEIEEQLNEAGYQVIGRVGNNVETYRVNRNAVGTYYYRLRSLNDVGYSAYSEVSSVELSVPDAPTNLRAERTGETEITLSWTCEEAYIDSFRVEESFSDQNNFQQVTRTVRNVLSTVLLDRSQAGTYYYRVVTVNSVDNSAFSATASINMAGPNAPTNMQAERSVETEFHLTWINNDELVDSIEIEEQLNEAGYQVIGRVGNNVETYRVNRNAVGTYYYRLRSLNDVGYSAYSEVTSVDLTVPNAPTNLRAERTGETEITLSWEDNDEWEDGFLLEESIDDEDHFEIVNETESNVVELILSDKQIRTGITYYYHLKAYNDIGFSTGDTLKYTYCLVAVADGSSGLHMVDSSDPNNPWRAGTYDTQGTSYGVFVVGDYTYVADGIYYFAGDPRSKMQVIDVSVPSNPRYIGSSERPGDGSCRKIFISNNIAYTADDADGVRTINIADPVRPSFLDRYDTPGRAFNVLVLGNLAYVADGQSGLQIIDVSDPADLSLASTYNTEGSALGICVVAEYAYVADGQAGLQIIDVADPENPELIGTYDSPGVAESVCVVGDLAYVADGTSGLQIIDISDPENPEQVGNYNTPGYAYDVAVKGNYAYIADDESGLQVIDVSDPTDPQRVGNYDSPGRAYGVAVAEDE